MSDVPGELRYTKSHEWVDVAGDGTVTVGVTDYAQRSLGDLVFVELPATGGNLDAGDACAVVESVKAASDVFAPLAGEVVEVNEQLAESPELVNEDPYGEGWLFKLAVADEEAVEALLDAEAYQAVVDEEEG
jgi:glycine cleavage system H protein